MKAYSEAVKAAEAALAQRVTPQNGKQTLGTMIRDVAQKPEAQCLRSTSLEVVMLPKLIDRPDVRQPRSGCLSMKRG